MYRTRRAVQYVAMILSTLVAVAVAAWWAPAPALAGHPTCGYRSEAQYLAGRDTSCRGTDTIAPPLGNPTHLLTRNQLLANAPWLASKGFDPSFLWFAPQRTERTDNLEWSFCEPNGRGDNNGPDDVCDDQGEHVDFEPASYAFGHTDVDVTILGDRNAFIALVCGNFSRAGRQYHPHMSGTKYHDQDADGVRDSGEPALAGWEFRVTLEVAALDRQSVGASRIVTSGADGR